MLIDTSFKQNVNNVSFMTNEIDLLTNSLSESDLIDISTNGMYYIIYFRISVIYIIYFSKRFNHTRRLIKRDR